MSAPEYSSNHPRKFSDGLRAMIALEANHQCSSCGEHTPLPAGEADHVFPWSLGGPTVRENGKWLCRGCNGAKSDLVNGVKLWQKGLRKWQQEFSFTFNEQEERNFLLYADPGAGKTVAALNVMAYTKFVNATKRFIYVVPSRSLRKQVIRSGNETAALGIHFREAPEVTDVWHWPTGATCLVVTMNFLNANRAADLRRLCDNDTVVIIDEVHHLSDENEFGKHAKHAFERARRILGMTGTPWRTDGSPIPFFRYDNANRDLLDADEKYIVATGFEVTWSECWEGKYGGEHPWVRVPVFKTFDGEWELNGEHYESVEDIRDEIGITRAYCSSYHNGLGFEQNKYSWGRLQGLRKHEPDAAELIVCSNIDQAKRVVEAIRRDRGYTPVLVSSDDEESGAKLERFAKSSDPTIVAVRMVLEGVDIPRLRIVNYQSFITTLLTMKQVLARAMRVRSGEKVLDCFMFGPNIDCFVDFSASIERETMNALKVRSDDLPEIKYQRERDGEKQDWTSYFEITAKDGWLSRTITRGELLDTNEVEEFRRKASALNDPELASMAERVYHVMNSDSAVPGDNELVDVEAQRKKLQKEVIAEIRKIGVQLAKQPKFRENKQIVFPLLTANAVNFAGFRDRKVDGLSPDEMKKLHWVIFNTERWKRERL